MYSQRLAALLATAITFTAAAVDGTEPHTPVESWSGPRLYHLPFDERFADRIRIAKSAWPSKLLQHHDSPNQAYWFGVIRPDAIREGPWDTKVFVDNEGDRPIQIDVVNHNNYPVEIRWINEKLLYIQVWWGRILGTYLIYDVEKEAVLAKEMIKDGRYLFQRYRQSQKLQPSR